MILRLPLVLLLAAGAAVAAGVVPERTAGPVSNTTAAGAPSDLALSSDDLRWNQALSNFAWGLFLHLQYEADQLSGPDLRQVLPVPQPPVSATSGKTKRNGPAKGRKITRADLPPYLQHYREAVRLAPEESETLELFAGSVIMAYDSATLISLLDELTLEVPDSSTVNLALAQLLTADKRYAEAFTILRSCLSASNWRDVAVVRQLCAGLWDAGQYEAAGEVLAEARGKPALKNSIGLATASAQYGWQMAGRPEIRSRYWAHRSSLRQADSYARTGMKLFLREYEHTPDGGEISTLYEDVAALSSLLQDVDRDADSLRLLEVAADVYVEEQPNVDFLRARSLIRMGRFDEAGKVLDTAAAALAAVRGETPSLAAGAPEAEVALPTAGSLSIQARRKLYQDFMALGALNLEAGRRAQGTLAYEQALGLVPVDTHLRLLLAILYLDLNQPEKTLDVLARVDKPLSRKLLLVSRAQRAQKKLDAAARSLGEAEEAARQAKEAGFCDREFYFYAAMLCEDLGLIDRSLERARQAHALNPADAVSANFLGYMLADHNRELTEAERLIKQALAVEPASEAYLDSLAWVYYRQGRFSEAAKAIRKALKLCGAKPDPVILDHAGDIAQACGRTEDARQHWQEALTAGAEKPEPIRAKLAAHPN